MVGDSQTMLDARAHFFETGNYNPIADAVASATVQAIALRNVEPSTRQAADESDSRAMRLAELGCGTGFYLHTAAHALTGAGAAVAPVAADLSPFAVRMAVRAVPGAAGVVLDVWQPLPFLDESLDGILSVFAPRNLPEFARTLRPDGCLIAVVPTTRHLQEVRAEGLAIGIPDGKPDALTEAASPWFTEEARTLVEFEMELAEPELDNVIGMGPSAHHSASTKGTDSGQPNDVSSHAAGEETDETHAVRRVTASVTVLTYRLTPAG